MSNSKLNSDQKAARKVYLVTATNANVTVVTDGCTTIAYQDNHLCTIAFSLSVMSPDEEKFRRKVGEFYALSRFFDGRIVKMGSDEFYSMLNEVFNIYHQ